MNKQKTLIFSLSAMLFLAVSFIVYSWTEPTTMPSAYNPPINTSSTTQTKTGEIGASVFRDADNSNYYINPSGNSKISGIISSEAGPIANDHLTTKGYVDGLFGNIEQETSLSNMMYIYGNNKKCPDDSIAIMKHWLATTCSGGSYCNSPKDCSTSVGWFESSPTCSYCLYYGAYQTCTANSWDAAICAKVGIPLYDNRHTEEQCRIWNGEPVTVEDNVKICKLSSATCPGGWSQYKSWSTTIPGQSPFPISSSEPGNSSFYYTGSHTWSNIGIESSYCNRCIGTISKREFCGSNDNCSNQRYYYYASITEIGCY